MSNGIHDEDKWAKYDADAREYYKAKAHAKSKWDARRVTMDKHSVYGRKA